MEPRSGQLHLAPCEIQGPARSRHIANISRSNLVARWSAMMSHAAMQTFAATLIDEDPSHHKNVEGNIPPLNQILAETPLAPYPPHPAFLFDLEGLPSLALNL